MRGQLASTSLLRGRWSRTASFSFRRFFVASSASSRCLSDRCFSVGRSNTKGDAVQSFRALPEIEAVQNHSEPVSSASGVAFFELKRFRIDSVRFPTVFGGFGRFRAVRPRTCEGRCCRVGRSGTEIEAVQAFRARFERFRCSFRRAEAIPERFR